MTKPTDVHNSRPLTSRRRLLRDGGTLAAGTVLAGGLAVSEAVAAGDSLPPNVPEWMKTPGDPMGSQLYGMPSPFEKDVIKNIPKDLPQYLSASGRTPLQDLDGIITPNGLFYERHHAGVPTIDPTQHRLMLHGMVDKPLIFTMDDIRRNSGGRQGRMRSCRMVSCSWDCRSIRESRSATPTGSAGCPPW